MGNPQLLVVGGTGFIPILENFDKNPNVLSIGHHQNSLLTLTKFSMTENNMKQPLNSCSKKKNTRHQVN